MSACSLCWTTCDARSKSSSSTTAAPISRCASCGIRRSGARRSAVVDFRRNFGQTAAIMAGIDHARGEIIISLDADLQNDPADIPVLLAKLEKATMSCRDGARTARTRRFGAHLISRVANRMISRISGVPSARLRLHAEGLPARGASRRPPVRRDAPVHSDLRQLAGRARRGDSGAASSAPLSARPKYGLERVVKVMLDLIVVKFLDRMFVKPIYVFGGFGLFAFVDLRACRVAHAVAEVLSMASR